VVCIASYGRAAYYTFVIVATLNETGEVMAGLVRVGSQFNDIREVEEVVHTFGAWS